MAPAPRSYPLGVRGKVGGGPYKGAHGASAPNNWESRNAYDIDVPVGTPVYAVTSGTIGSQIGSLGSKDPKMAGLRVHLVAAGNEFYYAHLSKLVVQAGDKVAAGQLLGYSGEANGTAHLHFAAKSGDPAAWLGERPRGGQPDVSGVAAPADVSAPVAAAAPVSPVAPIAGAGVPGTVPDPGSTQPYEPPPGSGMASTNSFLADMWNRIASQPGASPDSQLYAQNAQTLTGG